jgi:uncharacterized membrane protein
MDREKIVKAAITSFLTFSTASALLMSAAAIAEEKMEKCYGIVKAGMNDCQIATQSCAGSATKDRQRDAFIFLPPGTCNKIVDGKLTEK